ncbi:hypothetical protein MG118_004113 [Escherichia coli]|nr:hypothetical protein [Escherichia coli]
MIVKSSARSGGKALADHLINPEENERITITGSHNVTSDDVHEAIAEMVSMSAGWSGSKPLCHAHISPDQAMSEKDWSAAWAAYEKEFGLEGRPYIEVEHLKDGRLPHRHRAYLRVDTETHRANDVWRSKMRDEKVSRLLEHELGHKLTHGPHDFWVINKLQEEGRQDVAQWLEGQQSERSVKAGRAKNWDEHQQEKRTKIDKQNVRDDMAAAWQSGDSGSAVAAALEARGYVVAQGDKRDVVLVDVAGGVHSPARLLKQAGIDARAKAIRERFADLKDLPTVAQAQEMQGQHRRAREDRAAATGERPTPDQISSQRTERAQAAAKAREERRAAWIAERKAEYAAAKAAVLQAYRDEKANRREIGGHMWKAELHRRADERAALKSRLAGSRKRIYALVPRGLLRTLALAAHNHRAEREWAELKKRQAERWQQAKAVHPVPKWREFVQHRAAAGDVQAQLLARVRTAGRQGTQQAQPEAGRPVPARPGVARVGQNPPPAARGRLRTLADVEHLQTTKRAATPAVDPLAGWRQDVERAQAAGGGLHLDIAQAQLAVAQEFQAAGKNPRHHISEINEAGKQRAFAKLDAQPAEAQRPAVQKATEPPESEQERKRREILEKFKAKQARDKSNERGGQSR